MAAKKSQRTVASTSDKRSPASKTRTEKREAHMYIEIMVARDFNVCEFRTYGFKDMDFVNWMEGPGPPTPPTPPKSAAPAAPTGRASQSRSSKPEFHPLCSI